MILDFSAYSANQRYHIMTQTIIPRPIAWALTASETDIGPSINLAPFSYFTAVSSTPALLMLSIGKKPSGEPKDTLVNVIKNKKIVIHIASEKQAECVTQTAASLPHGESELNLANKNAEQPLQTVAFNGFDLPRLAQCDIAYGCELYEIKEVGDSLLTLIFVEVKQVYINDKVLKVDEKNRIKVFADQIKPLARLGGGEYSGISEVFAKKRPK